MHLLINCKELGKKLLLSTLNMRIFVKLSERLLMLTLSLFFKKINLDLRRRQIRFEIKIFPFRRLLSNLLRTLRRSEKSLMTSIFPNLFSKLGI